MIIRLKKDEDDLRDEIILNIEGAMVELDRATKKADYLRCCFDNPEDSKDFKRLGDSFEAYHCAIESVNEMMDSALILILKLSAEVNNGKN